MKKKSTSKSVQKILRFGIECELFTLDLHGFITNGADRLMKRVKREHPEVAVVPECGEHMIEITTVPHTEITDGLEQALNDLLAVVECAEKENLVLYAYGTYPGAFEPTFHSLPRYAAQEVLFGKERFAIAGRCIGLHIHYSLPWGVFDPTAKIIKPLINSKNKENLVQMYNLAIAMDPALTTFTQSSPFYQGHILGKDSRAITYRGGKELDYPDGLYAEFPEFGALPPYESTNTDLIHVILERFDSWNKIAKQVGSDVLTLSKHGSILDNTWNPVKINAHGTLEVRGMDMNHPDVDLAIALLIKYIFKAIQEGELGVLPYDSAIANPFARDGKTVMIPPDSVVRNDLQRRAVYKGLSDENIYRYCTNLLNLGKEFIPMRQQPLLEPLEEMIRTRETASDRIQKLAKKMGVSLTEELTAPQAAALALALSQDLYDETVLLLNKLRESKK